MGGGILLCQHPPMLHTQTHTKMANCLPLSYGPVCLLPFSIGHG